jgi:catechol 2,3-dioxygenase-like lactoylglutathione lyase family enzyme
MATVVALEVADAGSLWTDLGFAVDGDTCQVGSVLIHLVGGDGEGIGTWSLSGVALDAEGLDGLPTTVAPDSDTAPATATTTAHPNGVVAIDHIVVSTPDLERTIAAFDDAGLLLRRRRDAGATYGTELRQAFFRLGEVIVEVVGPAEAPEPTGESAPARFFGLAFTVGDMASTSSFLGERLSPTKEAVQTGRTIATLARTAGSTVAIAFMSPEPPG